MQEFKHSIKVPRNYKAAATILKKALTEGASVKSLVFNDKLKHYRTNVLYALISEAIKHNAELDNMLEGTQLLQTETRLDPWLAKILATELMYGKKCLPGKSKPETAVASYKDKFQQYAPDIPDETVKKGHRRPRYVRINTNLLTTSDAIREFQEEEYRFVRCTSGSYSDYLEQVKSLGEYDFMQDYHVKTMFVFAPGTKLHEHPLYIDSKIILQDKATALAIHLLAPPAGSVVMDMCAAPGMKTTQLAAYMRNQGTIYAIERSEERYKILCDFVEKTGSTCVKTLNKDSLDIKKGEYPDVEYVLLDPSCTGSGMDLCGHSYIEDDRLARLTSLQEKFLKHAMHAFPNVKKIVYSTCSLFPQENERVITNVVSQSRVKWNVMNVKELLKDQWNNFGSGVYGSMGARCLYSRPDLDLTTGFFMAVLEKDAKYFVKKSESTENEEIPIERKAVCDETNVECEKENETDEPKRKKKKMKRIHSESEEATVSEIKIENKSMTKKSEKQIPVEESNVADGGSEAYNDVCENREGRKSKKKKHVSNESLNVSDEVTVVGKTNVTSNTGNDEISTPEDSTDVQLVKKKKKMRNTETDTIKEDRDINESISKNKKKKLFVAISDSDEVPKLKKKKYQSHE